jgi:nucleoside-diphosphate-sugar epimerase
VKVFVAGATGAIGRPLIRQLVAAGHEVTGMTRSEARAREVETAGATAAVADVYDAERVRVAVAEAAPDVLVHQLTALPDRMNVRDLEGFYRETNRVRREGTPILLDAARAAGARRAVVQSIAFVYAPEGGPVKDESAPTLTEVPGPMGEAMRTVMDMERMVLEAEGIEGVVQRYGWLYGPGTYYAPGGFQYEDFKSRKQPIVGRGAGVNSFCHVEDAAGAAVAALQGGSSGVYNVCDDHPAPAREWMPDYAEAIGAKRPFRVPTLLARLAAPSQIVRMAAELRGADNSRFKHEFGWQPRWPDWRAGFREALG